MVVDAELMQISKLDLVSDFLLYSTIYFQVLSIFFIDFDGFDWWEKIIVGNDAGMHGCCWSSAFLVNAEADSMGGVVDGGVGIGLNTSPRRAAIEKAQAELR